MLSLSKRLSRPCGVKFDPNYDCTEKVRCKACYDKLYALRYIARLEKSIEVAGVKNEVAIAYANVPFDIELTEKSNLMKRNENDRINR